jgi:hypothetical protein
LSPSQFRCDEWDEHRAAEKAEADEDGKKKKGGISIPDEWPWEEAKKVFEKPDVTPADELEVSWIVFATAQRGNTDTENFFA